MTLAQVINAMKAAALAEPAVSMVVDNDIFRLNATPDATYGVFAYTQQQHSGELDSSFHRFAFNLFYVDRLTADSGNEIEVQSVAVEVLENIIRNLANSGIFAETYTIQTFTHRFLDLCAGAFANVTFEVTVDTVCAEEF